MGDRRLNPLHHRFREWWHAELDGRADVVLPEATSRAEQVFRDDSEVQDLFLNQYLYVVLYEYGVSMLSERRALLSEDGEWIGDPSPWLEFDPISRRHIAIESLTPEQAMAAAEFRERRIKTEQQRIAALKQLAEGHPVDSVIKTLPSTSLRDRMRGRAKPMDCQKCGLDLTDLVENVEFPKVTAEWRCRCGEPVTDEQGAEIDRIGFETSGSEDMTLWERLYGPVGSTEHPHFPTRHGVAPTVEQTGFCAACDAEIVYRCLLDGTPTLGLWDDGTFCKSCQKRLPPALRKALCDPFDYALQLRTGETFRFHECAIHGEWLHLSWGTGWITDQRDNPTAYPFERGLDVRIADIVWIADAPNGS